MLNDKVTLEAQQAQEMLALKEAASQNSVTNEKHNSYLSKRYAEFYRLMLEPDGSTKILGPGSPMKPPLHAY